MGRLRRLGIVGLVLLFGIQLISAGGLAAQQEGGGDNAAPTVNLELILDSSGSMVEATDTGQSKMDAAKAALHEVINAIPTKGAVNVGFRIYGHKGDNSDASKPVSCQASDLQVPVKGVDSKALLGAIDQAQPTGWTPIGRSLQLAAKDFPASGKNVTNTIVLVTDGTETCDSNPCQVAADIHNGPGKVVTNVIGFGTTAEDQQTLSCITKNGGGQLLSAGNDQQLRSALFSVLEQLDVVVGAGYIGGNAFSVLPPGEPGKLSVVGYSAPNSTSHRMAVVIRNNTSQDVVGPKVSVTIRDGGGTLIGAGDAMNMQPYYLRAGGFAIGGIFFASGVQPPADAQYEFKVSTTPSAQARYYNKADLDVVEANGFPDHITGTLKNGNDTAVKGPLFIAAVCLDENGAVLNYNLGTSNIDSLAAGDEQSFQVDNLDAVISGTPCPAYLVAGQGNGTPRLPKVVTPKPTPLPTRAAALTPVPVVAPTSTAAKGPSSGGGSTSSSAAAIPGLEDAATRNFESDTGTQGIQILAVSVARFASSETADKGIEAMISNYLTAAKARGGGTMTWSDPKPTSAPKLGDRRVAETWTVTAGPGIELVAALLAVRHGKDVYFFVAMGQGINPTQVLVDLAKTVVTDAPRQPASDGLKTGGLWDLLPTLEEVPSGLHVSNEIVPHDFGPLAAVSGTPEAMAAAPAPVATEVEIELADIKFVPNTVTIPAGVPVKLTLTNSGALPHDFTIDKLNISVEVDPGSAQETTITVPAGTYQFYCAQPGHRAAGMVGTLTAS